MCGIVGYCGPQEPKEVILQGLAALEYRGYDSAGVSILNAGDFKRVRAEGKLSRLKEKLESENFDGHLGIGHTRWATHGAPSERNAHPHCVSGVSLVHNGIIENYSELSEQIRQGGAQLESETDSELVAHLIADQVQLEKNLLQAVIKTRPQLNGAYSILTVFREEPEHMVAFKNGPPLIIGVGEKETIVASDIQAIVEYTKKVIYLEDDEIASIRGTQIDIFDGQGQPVQKEVTEIKWDADRAEKQGYPHYMLKEIFEQPRAVAAAIDPHIDISECRLQLNRLGFAAESLEELENLDPATDWQKTLELFAGIDKVYIIACGTSFYAGLVGKYLIERMVHLPVEVDVASEFRYRHPVIEKNALGIVISQSGETADTLAALRLLKQAGATTLSICNVQRSTIDREADGHLYMNAGPEISVASTKALVCTLSLLNLLTLAFAKSKKLLNEDDETELLRQLIASPSQMETVLAYDKFFGRASQMLKQFRGFLYMGRGVNYPMAMEGALKLKELAYMHAEGYAAGEMKHGPLALIDTSMAVVMLAPSDEVYEKTLSNLQEAKARGGQIISIGSGDNKSLKEISEHYLSLPEAHWMVNPLLEVIPLQLMAYHIADALGHDVDQPRNLAKSVTVE